MSIQRLKSAIDAQKQALFELEAAVMEFERSRVTESVTIAEAARRIGINRATAHRWVSEGKMHTTPAGRVPASEVTRLKDTPKRRGAA